MIERWDAERLLEAMAPHLPLLVTDIARGNLAYHPSIATAIEQGVRRDGSSTGSLFVQEASWRTEKTGWTRKTATTTLTFGAVAAERIGRVLAARLPFGRGLIIEAENSSVAFRPGDHVTITDLGDGCVEIQIPLQMLAELTDALRPVAGIYRLASVPDLTVRIIKSQIRDQEGAVVAEIG